MVEGAVSSFMAFNIITVRLRRTVIPIPGFCEFRAKTCLAEQDGAQRRPLSDKRGFVGQRYILLSSGEDKSAAVLRMACVETRKCPLRSGPTDSGDKGLNNYRIDNHTTMGMSGHTGAALWRQAKSERDRPFFVPVNDVDLSTRWAGLDCNRGQRLVSDHGLARSTIERNPRANRVEVWSSTPR